MRFWQLLAYRRGEHTPEPDLAAIDPAFREVILHMTQLDPGTRPGISMNGCLPTSLVEQARAPPMQLIYSRVGGVHALQKVRTAGTERSSTR